MVRRRCRDQPIERLVVPNDWRRCCACVRRCSGAAGRRRRGADAAGAAGQPYGQGRCDGPARAAADGAEHTGVGLAAAGRRLGEEARWARDGNAGPAAGLLGLGSPEGLGTADGGRCRGAPAPGDGDPDARPGTGHAAAGRLRPRPSSLWLPTPMSLDSSAAMQRIGRHLLTDARLTWVNAPAEHLADHVPARSVDAVVCNLAIWKTNVAAVVTAVRRILRPGGRFVFNIGGAFAGVAHPDALPPPAGPSLSSLIEQMAARDYGIVPPTADGRRPSEAPAPRDHRASGRCRAERCRRGGHRPAHHHG
ncbi:methyltransferase domain-containing protein [Streptomyces sp. NPDC058701]|uniref:methyltransferase domain-containing protein n=1 Tax=Streptomyces sp. NPDC058701 TaxID=3346608 RepID=UPI003665C559